MKVIMYIMANDTKWVEREEDLPFFPFHGLDLTGMAADQPLRINSVSYDLPGQFFKIRLSWMSNEPINSKDLVDNHGWKLVQK
jgi:hypothetical protein